MGKVYRSAMGKPVDIDMLRLANEGVIAVGNMRTNARGDELGQGGQVVKTRAQVMQDYHRLNTPMAEDEDPGFEPPSSSTVVDVPKPSSRLKTPVAEEAPVVDTSPSQTTYVKPRGSFANSVAQQTEVVQETIDPNIYKNLGNNGVQRI